MENGVADSYQRFAKFEAHGSSAVYEERRARLRAAVDLFPLGPPRLIQGDLIEEVQHLIDAAPHGATVVVIHSAVLVYVDPDRRSKFVEFMRSHNDVEWISNEGEHVIPSISAQLPRPAEGRLVLAHNGNPIAFVGSHGQGYERIK